MYSAKKIAASIAALGALSASGVGIATAASPSTTTPTPSTSQSAPAGQQNAPARPVLSATAKQMIAATIAEHKARDAGDSTAAIQAEANKSAFVQSVVDKAVAGDAEATEALIHSPEGHKGRHGRHGRPGDQGRHGEHGRPGDQGQDNKGRPDDQGRPDDSTSTAPTTSGQSTTPNAQQKTHKNHSQDKKSTGRHKDGNRDQRKQQIDSELAGITVPNVTVVSGVSADTVKAYEKAVRDEVAAFVTWHDATDATAKANAKTALDAAVTAANTARGTVVAS